MHLFSLTSACTLYLYIWLGGYRVIVIFNYMYLVMNSIH